MRNLARRLVRRIVPSRGRAARIGRFRAPRDLRPLLPAEVAAVETFHHAYYDAWDNSRPTGRGTISLSWFGYKTLKCPFDLWTYQEILVDTRPEVVIETGTRHGGSTHFIASMLDLLGHGRVVTVDIEKRRRRPVHPRIEYLTGSSTDPAIVERIRRISAGRRTMVILDSDHSRDHVSAEIDIYADLVSVGCYLIVEDTNLNGHPVVPDFGPGPHEAVEAFLARTTAFEIDHDRERFLLTLNPDGFLRRIA